MKISVYGAGQIACELIPILKNKFEIEYIMDKDVSKLGKDILGIKIVDVNEEHANKYPVIILLKNWRNGFESLSAIGCTSGMYYVSKYERGLAICAMDNSSDELVSQEKSTVIPYDEHDILQAEVEHGDYTYCEGQKRVFNISSFSNYGATGGPTACLRNLFLANNKYKTISNLFVMCPTKLCVPEGYNLDKSRFEVRIYERSSLLSSIVTAEDKKAESIRWFLFELKHTEDFLERASILFAFSEDDVFLIQDHYAGFVFPKLFPHYKNVVCAYHTQGSVRSELAKALPELGDVFDRMQIETMTFIKNWIYPSKGALEGFKNTACDALNSAIDSCNNNVAYNGYEKKKSIFPDEDFRAVLDEISKDVIFASATFLYRNKGVERIPYIISEFKRKTGLSVKWILIGGGEMEKEVEDSIHEYLDEDDYIWYKERFDNQDNVFALFDKADFYAMMHYVSIFDLSILQAMSYGCVPLLTNLGGNKELCGRGNGILVNPENMMFDISNLMSEGKFDRRKLERLKEQNVDIVQNIFNDGEFVSKYNEVLTNL